MTVVEINNKLFLFPENWNELTAEQCRKIFYVLHSNYTGDQMLLQFSRILSGCGWWHFFRELKIKVAEQCFHLCSFIWEKTELTNQPLVKYKGLYGPKTNFDNLRMGEYAYAQNFFEQYRDNEDVEALNKLCAVLYRPAKKDFDAAINPDEDIRIPFSEASMEYHLQQVSKWPRAIREMIFFWYGGCFKKMMEDNADVFTGGGGEPALHGIVSVMRNVAKDGTYGDFKAVEQLFVKLFFLELKESKHEAAQMKKD
jgi:hypothetical protein